MQTPIFPFPGAGSQHPLGEGTCSGAPRGSGRARPGTRWLLGCIPCAPPNPELARRAEDTAGARAPAGQAWAPCRSVCSEGRRRAWSGCIPWGLVRGAEGGRRAAAAVTLMDVWMFAVNGWVASARPQAGVAAWLAGGGGRGGGVCRHHISATRSHPGAVWGAQGGPGGLAFLPSWSSARGGAGGQPRWGRGSLWFCLILIFAHHSSFARGSNAIPPSQDTALKSRSFRGDREERGAHLV